MDYTALTAQPPPTLSPPMKPERAGDPESLRHYSDTTLLGGSIPRIPLNLREHKIPIAVTATITLTFSCVLPIVLHFTLKYAAHTSDNISLVVPTVVFGAQSVVPLIQRTWALLKKRSDCRPLGVTGRTFDYFHWNFVIDFILLTVVISVGSSFAGSDNPTARAAAVRVASMPLSLIIILVCGQMVIVFIAQSLLPTLKYPCRISSMPSGAIIRPASYTIVEDVIAVDGKQGTTYRRMLNQRYEFSRDVRGIFRWADAVWGFSGVALAVAVIAIVWTVPNLIVGWAVGWGAPWIWAGFFSWVTIKKTQSALRKEESRYNLK